MKLTKQKAKENLTKLVEKFQQELDAGKIFKYNEEATKMVFIQPFLKDVLGWNVNDRDEVSPEENVSRGRVDYGLKINGKIRVFVEAKPPAKDLTKPVFVEQAIRYGYSKKTVPCVLLTDFEEFRLFDVTVKPDKKKLKKGLAVDLRWDEYLVEFDKLWLLSKESVINGDLEKFIITNPKFRQPVDKEILDDLKDWREKLAKDIYKNNHKIFNSGDLEKDAEYLKEITQKILDRIIFMRSCEDRRLIQGTTLEEKFAGRDKKAILNAMAVLGNEFKYYRDVFNSDLFNAREWEDDFYVSFSVIAEIIDGTCDPYEFDAIPIEVLGNIYEQFLGYTIRLTPQQVKYELKPDVRKAGGIYYTPEYIVDYIVENTVGKILKEFSLTKTKRLRILDPACGSGSFLIRAYEEVLGFYAKEKVKKAGNKRKDSHPTFDLEYDETGPRLTIHEKSEILKKHIFGVDIDKQAVEVTKLSLMLKMLEGEAGIIHGKSLLPALDKNIRCGNSLISGDTLELKKYFGEDWHKVKPFNWNDEFKGIMEKEGGFSVVIGNPPYGAEMSIIKKKFLNKKFVACQKNNNSYVMFLSLAAELIKKHGVLGFIIPTTFLTGDNFVGFRKNLLKLNINQIIKLPYDTFADAYIDTCICIVGNESFNSKVRLASIPPKAKVDSTQEILRFIKSADKSCWKTEKNCNFTINEKLSLIKKKISKNPIVKLEEICQIDRGTLPPKKTSDRKVDNDEVFYWFDGQVYRYIVQEKLTQKILCKDLKEFKTSQMFKGERLLLRQLISRQFRINATIVNKDFAFKKNLYCIYKNKSDMNLKYVLAIINSKLFSFLIYNSIAGMQKNDFPSLSLADARSLPIRKINFSDHSDQKVHDNFVSFVDVILSLNKKLQSVKGAEKEQLQRRIEQTDREIDSLVYKIYGITKEERKIIEGEVK